MEQVVAIETNTIVIGDYEYAVVGTPDKLPMSIFRPARMLAKKIEVMGVDEASKEAFYLANMDTMIDLMDEAITFALGQEQTAMVQKELNAMPVLEYIHVGVQVLGKLQQPGI